MTYPSHDIKQLNLWELLRKEVIAFTIDGYIMMHNDDKYQSK